MKYVLNRKTCTSVPDKLLLVARKKDIRIRQLLSKAEVDMVIRPYTNNKLF